MKHCHALLLTFPLIALNASAGGIILSEMATFDSVSSAGVANALNRKDASAAMSSPAGLTHIEDYSYSIGLQYVDADFDFKGELNETTPVKTSGANQQFAPGLAYAQRVSDSVVLAGSLHAEGGLGMKYSNGLNGQNMVDELAISVINMNFAAGYQATSNLSLGGGLIVQHIISELEASHGDAKVKGDGSSTELGFLLSAMFDLSDSTYIAANYKSKIEHDYKLDLKANSQTLSKLASATTWPATLDVGVSHNLNEQMNIKIRAAYENWKDYGNASGHDMENIYSLGTSLSYTHQKWTYQGGIRFESEMLKSENMTPDLSVGKQWLLGFGAEKELKNQRRVGIAYEYRDMGQPEVTYDGIPGNSVVGEFTKNRLHFVTLSYAY